MKGRFRAGALFALTAGVVFGRPITWTLYNATFNDGGSASGYFVFDADAGTVTDWNIVATAGSALKAFTYTPSSSSASGEPKAMSFASHDTFNNGLPPPYNFNETRYLDLRLLTSLTDNGGNVNIDLSASHECLDCNPYRVFTQGFVQTATTATLSTAPVALNYQIQEGGPPQSQSLQISGTAGIAWQATAAAPAASGWLTVSPASGQIPASLVAIVNAGVLSPGTYQGSITIQAPGATPGSIVITVMLRVAVASGQIGIITTVAGGGNGNDLSTLHDGIPATSAYVCCPNSVAVDASGNLFIPDKIKNRIQKVSAIGIITTVAGGVSGVLGDGGPGNFRVVFRTFRYCRRCVRESLCCR